MMILVINESGWLDITEFFFQIVKAAKQINIVIFVFSETVVFHIFLCE